MIMDAGAKISHVVRQIYDFIAVGVGPFNLGLACLTEPIAELDGLFLDRNERFCWHPGMLLDDATLQTPFMGDLVTLADPTSRFSFLNYVKRQGRIYAFYIKENFFLMRNEFNQYCQWAADQLPNVEFDRLVERVDYDAASKIYLVTALCTRTGARFELRARRLVIGVGTQPAIPACCRPVERHVTHTASYLADKETLQSKRSITVVGSGQSAAEIYHDLLKDSDARGYQLNWVTRSPRFFPLELTKLTLEMTSPDYADYFHGLPAPRRDALIRQQKNLYKGINASLINDIYDLLYNKSLVGEVNTTLHTNTELASCAYDEATGRFRLGLKHLEQGESFDLETEALVLGTGYEQRVPAFIEPIRDRIRWDERGRFAVRRNYSIDVAGGGIFVQNAELHTHGFVAPDLGMAAYRNASIIRAMTGREIYPIEKRIAFQRFGAPSVGARRREGART
jgi:lysine N6-hydroxylase